jgi:hypothetical protein
MPLPNFFKDFYGFKKSILILNFNTMKKYKISVLLVIILCFCILPSYATASGTENVAASKEIVKKESLEKQKTHWTKVFNDLVRIESNRLYNLNNNITVIEEVKKETFAFDPEYGLGYWNPGCTAYAYGDISFMYASLLGCASWSGYQSGCININSGGGGQSCEGNGPCEF